MSIVIVSPTLNNSTRSPSKNAFQSRRYSEVNPSIMAGLKMREQSQVLKDQMMKNQALENRIKRLAFEQQRAQKLTDIATEKAGKLLDARDRHQR